MVAATMAAAVPCDAGNRFTICLVNLSDSQSRRGISSYADLGRLAETTLVHKLERFVPREATKSFPIQRVAGHRFGWEIGLQSTLYLVLWRLQMVSYSFFRQLSLDIPILGCLPRSV